MTDKDTFDTETHKNGQSELRMLRKDIDKIISDLRMIAAYIDAREALFRERQVQRMSNDS